jgi:hypothetical protein
MSENIKGKEKRENGIFYETCFASCDGGGCWGRVLWGPTLYEIS